MFDNRWENWTGDFGDSFEASLIDSSVRRFVPDILNHFGEAVLARDADFPDSVSSGTFAAVLTEAMPRLNLPDEARPHIPEVVARFFEYLEDHGRLAEGGEWAATIRVLSTSYQERLKPNGGVKGVTIRKVAQSAPVGRNDPCPCGSGKKFKKCCSTRS